METICCQRRILNESDEEKQGAVLPCGKGTVYVWFKEHPDVSGCCVSHHAPAGNCRAENLLPDVRGRGYIMYASDHRARRQEVLPVP